MTMTSLYTPLDERYRALEDDWAAHDEQILRLRAELLAHLADGLGALGKAARVLDELRSPAVYDTELAEGRDGRDIAAFIDGNLRQGRAAYAVLHMVLAREGPR